jgi:lipopolysaccharide transport system ATP-binding protein
MNTEVDSVVIRVSEVSKVYEIYKRPSDRFKQLLFGWRGSYFKPFWALNKISFEVPRGQSIGVIGKNGAGKSTLLQILTGTVTPTSGKVEINGTVAAVLELGSGFNPEFSGMDNIFLYASLFGLSRTEIKRRLQKIVDFSELQEFVDQPVKTYSSGMQARLAFAVIAHLDAEILIVDEALSVGDAFFAQKCLRFLREFKRRGGTIFFVSHDLSAVINFCDHAIWLQRGKMLRFGPAKEVCESYFASSYEEHTGVAVDSAEPSSPTTNSEVTTTPVLVSSSDIVTDLPNKGSDLDPAARGLQHIKSFGFDLDSASFGTGAAKILEVTLSDLNGHPLTVCEGGLSVKVRILAEAVEHVDRPVIGFIVKDRLGQPLLGGNTYEKYANHSCPLDVGERLEACFEFRLPILAIGDYSLVAAIANGTVKEHVQLHWVHDALLFQVLATSIEGVLVGMPLDKVVLEKVAST